MAYKFIEFIELAKDKDTSIWECNNKKTLEQLGVVQWYSSWRRYCFQPSCFIKTIYSAECLDDISDFIKKEMEKRK